jgi:hypothetical protein
LEYDRTNREVVGVFLGRLSSSSSDTLNERYGRKHNNTPVLCVVTWLSKSAKNRFLYETIGSCLGACDYDRKNQQVVGFLWSQVASSTGNWVVSYDASTHNTRIIPFFEDSMLRPLAMAGSMRGVKSILEEVRTSLYA